MTALDWAKGVGYSILASIVGGASKLAIRKSWLMVEDYVGDGGGNGSPSEDAEHNNTTTDSSSPYHRQADDDLTGETAGGTLDGDSNHERHLGLQQTSSPLEMVAIEGIDSSASSTSIKHNDTKAGGRVSTERIAVALRLAGMVGMTFLNPLFCVLAMRFASPSILAPFSGLTLVWIVLFSETMIGEKPNEQQILAAVYIVVGEIIVAIWGDHTNDEGLGLQDVEESYSDPYFHLYFFAMLVWIGGLVYIIIVRPTPILTRFAWGVAGGSVTGFQNFLKDSLTIVKAVHESGGGYPWYFYLMVLSAMGTAFGGLLFLTECMKRYDATFSSAMFVGSFVISASIMSAVHYRTFEHLEGFWNWLLYPTGLIVLMVGVDMLVKATDEQQEDVEQRGENDTNSSDGSNSSNEMRYPLMTASEEERISESDLVIT